MEPSPDIFGHAFQVRTKERLLRDPLHGLIPIDENSPHGRLAVDLIDCAEMQRLRRIRQLGLAHYAFPGAEHTRFTHSIGAFHLLRKIVEQLSRMYTIDSELAFYASIAALLHDLGHGPFSHVSERIFGVGHEEWTVRILHDSRTDVNRLLSAYSRRFPSIIESLLIGMAKPGYLSSLLNSELDADRLDYLLRDSLMTGVKYGVYDLDRLIHMLRISPEGDKIVVAHGGLVPVEKYIQARYHMHRQVYLHKTVIAAEAMLTALLRRARELIQTGNDAGLEPNSLLRRALDANSTLDVVDYLELDDVEILAQIKRWSSAADPVLADLSNRLLNRRLFKTIEIDPKLPQIEDTIKEAEILLRREGLDPRYYLLRVDSADTPYHPYERKAERTSQHIWIDSGEGKIVDVADVSPTIRVFTESDYTASRIVFPESCAKGPIRAEIGKLFTSTI